jgi:hypothetical protein
VGAGVVKIRILHNFDCYERGQVFDNWPGGMCDILIRRGLIERVETAEQPQEAVERADIEPRQKVKRRG